MNDNLPTAETVCERFEALSPKLANPLRVLVKRRGMPPWMADAVLDAGENAGETRHLLGFAIAMLRMHRFDVTVLDAMRVAKPRGRRVNLR